MSIDLCARRSFLIDSGFGVALTTSRLQKNPQLFTMATSHQEYRQRIVDNQTLACVTTYQFRQTAFF
jgi:hypothetical protein